jgi:diguanylate cyclase (GGDEF)-like protein
MKRFVLIFVMVVLLSGSARAAQMVTLTQLSEIHKLTNDAASKRIPVHFEATVTYYRGYENNLFVQDGNTAIYIAAQRNLQLVPGDRVLVTGKTRNSFNPIVTDSSIMLLRHGGLPLPEKATFEQMIRAETDCKLVTVRGVVRTANLLKSLEAPEHFIRLQLLMLGGFFDANVDSDDPGAIEKLLDSEVELTGVASEQFDNKMQQSGVLLHVQSLADVKILNRAASSPWNLPLTPIDRVITLYHFDRTTPRVRIHGTITYYLPGSALVLQDGAKSIWISTQMTTPLRIGDAADAIGFPDVHDGFVSLTYGEARDSLKPATIAPLKVGWKMLSSRGYDSPGHHDDLVSIEGKVITEVNEDSQDEMVLAAEGRQFSAIYRHPFGRASSFRGIPLGAKVRVTGICVLEYSNPFIDPMPFTILLRDFNDIEVVARPSPINTRNLLIALGLLLVVVFGVIARGWSLEHKVRRQTAVWAARTEAEAEVERQRSRILEDINGSRTLTEIHEEIAAMVSSTLKGAHCWVTLADGTSLGVLPSESLGLRNICEEIRARSGPALGKICAGLDPQSPPTGREMLALRNGARLASLAIETRRLYSDLRRRSEFDLLTDIPNRFAMEKSLDLRIEEARSSASIFGLIYIDLDRFKPINDRYGHHIGDLFLQAVTLRMSKQLQGSDMLARLGGDEFAALVMLQNGRFDLERIIARLESCFIEPFSIEGHLILGAASIGFALFPEDGATPDDLLNAADAAMYVAKKRNKQIAEEEEPHPTSNPIE